MNCLLHCCSRDRLLRDQDRLSFETFGSRPRPGIIETKTEAETGNYSASKNTFIPPSFSLFFIFQKVTITFQVN